MPDTKHMTKTQRVNWSYGVDAHRMIEYDLHEFVMEHRSLPAEWHQIWQDKDRRDGKRQPVTMRMDADVVRFFKAMGDGYQHRINRVLRMFMHYRLAGIIEGPDTTDYVLRPETLRAEKEARAKWGDFEKGREGGG
ncbi:BrnA antitoxin family protein [Yoonia sp.]|uniref:BrnA antitoxin family protein n=1 Tax=Yoonia sp. TaxID=2212373 RepID=UPI0025F7ACEC|nr:BrnA antitoxin family protein [Yoonia sp.]